VRKAGLRGAAVGFVNPERHTYYFPVATQLEVPVGDFARSLAGVVAAAAAETGQAVPGSIASGLEGIEAGAGQVAAARVLLGRENALIVLGHIAQRHPQYSQIRALAAALAELTGAKLGYLAEGANGAGAALVGFLPHRDLGGKPAASPGFHTRGMLSSPRHGYILFGLEPDGDLAAGELASEGLKSADVVVSFSSFVSDSLLECATVLLPIGTFAETSGTFVNAEGRRQTFEGAANPVGESRPGWRVLRVLGNMLEVPNCEYQTSREVLDELTLELGAIVPDNGYAGTPELALDEVEVAIEDVDVPIYSVDALVRRSEPLQATRLGQDARPDADSGFARSA